MTESSQPAPPQEVWVIDTCSVNQVFRDRPKGDQEKAAALLTKLARAGQIVFPPQVIEEMKRHALAKQHGAHPPLQLCLGVQNVAEIAPTFDTVKEVLRKVEDVLDPQKPTN